MTRTSKSGILFPRPWGRLDRLLVVIAVILNLWAAMDWAGFTTILALDAPARALRKARRAEKDAPAMLLRRDALVHQLQGRHPWAGKYYGPYGNELSVAPGLGYRRKGTDFSGRPWLDDGELRDQPSRLVLRSTKRDIETASLGIVRWGSRVYLMSDARLIDFANAVNKGEEPRKSQYGDFLLREGDWSKPVAGRPLAPGFDRDYFLAAPIETRILKTGVPRPEPPELKTSLVERVVLDAGRTKGLLAGMLLYPLTQDRRLIFKILSASKRSCVAEASFLDMEPAPQPGWRLSTRDDRPPLDLTGSLIDDIMYPDFHGWELGNGYGQQDEE